MVLGSGLGGFSGAISSHCELFCQDIPGWPSSTAAGHSGKVIFGSLGDMDIAVMAGRTHLYEGYSPSEVIFGVRVLGRMGVKSLVVTNAAGGINPSFKRGQLVLVSDHINLQGSNPLAGPNDESMGPRFPAMLEAYSADYRRLALDTAEKLGIDISEGVYAAVLGPSYETPAEIRFLRTIGADLVGMSTVPEVIAANHMGMRVLAISCVTNMAAGIGQHGTTHEMVLETSKRASDTLTKLLCALLPSL